MPQSSAPRRAPVPMSRSMNAPITAPSHGWFTSPARSHATSGQGKELPLHLIQLILEYLDDAADLARVTRTSRLFYYMTLPRLYEEVTLRSYADIRYVDSRPVGFGGGSPFAVGLNTLVSRKFPEYTKTFRVIGEWREHDVEDYSKGRVPDNSLMLQIAMRAALDKMANISAFAWELNTKPLQTVYEGLMHKPSLTSLTLRCPLIRIPRPTAVVPPIPNLKTLIMYDIDPLCYPDSISQLLFTSKKLESLKLHWHPRMRESGEESVNLLNYFGRCIAAKHRIPLKRMAFYNLYARHGGEGFETVMDNERIEEITMINSIGATDPMNVFVDDTWRVKVASHPVPHNLKMMRIDNTDKEMVWMMHRFQGLERLYLVSLPRWKSSPSKANSTVQTPTTPSTGTTPVPAATNGASAAPPNGTTNGAPVTETQCKSLAGAYLAVIQSNHRTMQHLLLSDHWSLSSTALFKICQTCPNLEQLGFASTVPPLESIRQAISLCPKLWAVRILVTPGSALAEQMEGYDDMHMFMMSRELWKEEFLQLRYIGMGDLVWRLGGVIVPKDGAGGSGGPGTGTGANGNGNGKEILGQKMGPIRVMDRVERKDVEWIAIWGMDSVEFEAKF